MKKVYSLTMGYNLSVSKQISGNPTIFGFDCLSKLNLEAGS